MIKKLLQKIVATDTFLDTQTPLFLLLVLVVVLRIPNFFEPYWYGDEGIYLTIGQSLNKGVQLYSEIIDHKTPLIYYLARVDTQLNFRLLTLAWMLATTTAFYYFAKKILPSIKHTFFAALIFVLLTTLPWLEGNIPNGELFVLGFVLIGLLLISKTVYFTRFLENKLVTKSSPIPLFLGGFCIGLGIMTKVPAIFDLGAAFSIAYFSWINSFSFKKWNVTLKHLLQHIYALVSLLFGALSPAILSIIYFISIGSGKEYLDYGLLYNFRYAGSWQLPFENQFLVQSFTLPGKLLYFLLIILLLTILRKYIKPVTQFVLFWFSADLFASLLSNRPYPHYFIQLVPPLALSLPLLAGSLVDLARFESLQNTFKKIVPISLFSVVFFLFISVMLLLEFRPYKTIPYYKNWVNVATGSMSKEEYRQTFDSLMKDNYLAAPMITSVNSRYLFIWGTNPMLYALTNRQPTGRFTVSFHIKDFDAFDETVQSVKDKKPEFIVVMKNEDHPFPEFYSYLTQNYVLANNTFDTFVLWKKINANNN